MSLNIQQAILELTHSKFRLSLERGREIEKKKEPVSHGVLLL